jgi:aminoglycoside/choline kinase family phosphotransferase
VNPTTRIPKDPAELTAAWLNGMLAGTLAPVSGVAVRGVARPGAMSDAYRLSLRYAPSSAEGERPSTLIVKLSTLNAAMRTRPATRAGVEKEVRFYTELAPGSGLPVPRCFHAEADAVAGWHVLVLEDAAPAVQRAAEDGCSRAEAELAVTALARLHAGWWNRARLDELAWLPRAEPLEAGDAAERHRAWWPAFRDQTAGLLPAEMLTFGDAYAEAFPRLMNDLLFALPRTLRHGDYSLANLFFASSEGGSFRIIDWQMLGRGKGAWDLAWFLGQSLSVSQRRAWEMALIATYLDTLRAAGVDGYDTAECLRDYRCAIAQRFGTLISSLVALPFTAAQKETIRRVQLPRNVAAIRDHGGLSLLEG